MSLIDESESYFEELNALFAKLFQSPATLGGQYRDRRRSLNINQKQLAAIAGVTFKDVSDLENDRPSDSEANSRIIAALDRLLSEAKP